MRGSIEQHWSWLKKSFGNFGRTDPLILGSSIAFFTIFALPGVLVILLRVAATFTDPVDVKGAMASQAAGLVGNDMAGYLVAVLQEAQISDPSFWDQAFGIAAIIISGTMAFMALQRGLDRVWGVQMKKGKGVQKQLVTRAIALLIMAGMSILLPISLLFDDLIAFFFNDIIGVPSSQRIEAWTSRSISFLILFLIIAVLFKVVPNAKIGWRDVWPGALLSAVLMLFARSLIAVYVKSTGIGAAFGAGQMVLLILVWAFLAAMILLFGAFHCHTVATARGGGIAPGRRARSVDNGDR